MTDELTEARERAVAAEARAQAAEQRLKAVTEALRETLDMAELFIPAKLDAPGFKRARQALAAAQAPAGENSDEQ